MTDRYILKLHTDPKFPALRWAIEDTKTGNEVAVFEFLADAGNRMNELNRAGADAIEIERLEMESTLSRPDRFEPQ